MTATTHNLNFGLDYIHQIKGLPVYKGRDLKVEKSANARRAPLSWAIGKDDDGLRLASHWIMGLMLGFCSTAVDTSNREAMLKIINSAISTKAINRWSDLACNIALDAVRTVELEENGRKEIDIKKYAKVEKVQRNGGFLQLGLGC